MELKIFFIKMTKSAMLPHSIVKRHLNMKLLHNCWETTTLRQANRNLQRLVALCCAAALFGCSGPPPVSGTVMAPNSGPESAVVSTQSQTLSLAEQEFASNRQINSAYRLGPDDIISVSIYSHPELSSPQPGASVGNGGVMITSDGTVGLPLIGSINLNGLDSRASPAKNFQRLRNLYQ